MTTANNPNTRNLRYVTLQVRRSLNESERDHLARIDDDDLRSWEEDRQTLLFQIAVLATTEKDAVSRVRSMLSSPELIVEILHM